MIAQIRSASLVIASVLLVACQTASAPGETSSDGTLSTKPDDYCTTDSDCVPAQCCHATRSVNNHNAPNCSDSVCTMDCRPGTLDCGGTIKCIANKCTAVIPKNSGGLDVQ